MSSIKIEAPGRTIEFGVCNIPNRKSKCLYNMRGANFEVLAYFTSDQNAEKFKKSIDDLIETFADEEETQ